MYVCICFYCDKPLTWETALLTPFGKTSCADCKEKAS